MAQSQPLTLEATAFHQATGWRRGQHLVDALPYVDTLSEESKRAVDKLIEEELRLSAKSPADYLRELPPIPQSKFEGHAVLVAEQERLRRGEPMKALDISRYRLDPPPLNRRNDYSAWKAALDNAHSQLEHQYNRLLNLELLLKFGPHSWRLHNEALQALKTRLEAAVSSAKSEVERINQKRKLAQQDAAKQLSALEQEWMAGVVKNAHIGSACAVLEAEVLELREQMEQRLRKATEASLSTHQPATSSSPSGPPLAARDQTEEPEASSRPELQGSTEVGAEHRLQEDSDTMAVDHAGTGPVTPDGVSAGPTSDGAAQALHTQADANVEVEGDGGEMDGMEEE